MLRDLFIGATAVLSVGGIGGAVALVVACLWLGPPVVVAFVDPLIAKFIGCKPCIVVTVAALATIGAFWIGRLDAESDCIADKRNSAIAAQQADKAAEKQAAADEADRVSVIEKVAKAQHESDLAEIERIKGSAPPACAFDDDGLRNPSRAAGAKPPAVAKAPHKSAAGPAARRKLLFPLVWPEWMQGKGHAGDAAPDGKR